MMEDGRVGVGVDRRCVVVNGRSEDVVLTCTPSSPRGSSSYPLQQLNSLRLRVSAVTSVCSFIMYSPETESKRRNLCEEERGIHQTQVNIANSAMSRYVFTPVSLLLSHRTYITVAPLSFSLP